MIADAKVRALARKTGAMIECRPVGEYPEVLVMAPEGQHFTAVGIHESVNVYHRGLEPAESAWTRALRDMEGGFEPCTAETPCSDWRDGCQWWVEEGGAS